MMTKDLRLAALDRSRRTWVGQRRRMSQYKNGRRRYLACFPADGQRGKAVPQTVPSAPGPWVKYAPVPSR